MRWRSVRSEDSMSDMIRTESKKDQMIRESLHESSLVLRT